MKKAKVAALLFAAGMAVSGVSAPVMAATPDTTVSSKANNSITSNTKDVVYDDVTGKWVQMKNGEISGIYTGFILNPRKTQLCFHRKHSGMDSGDAVRSIRNSENGSFFG